MSQIKPYYGRQSKASQYLYQQDTPKNAMGRQENKPKLKPNFAFYYTDTRHKTFKQQPEDYVTTP